MTDILPSKLTFDIEDLEHQNIVELKTVLNNSFWGADNYAHSEKQIVIDTNENCTAQTHISGNYISNAAEDQPTSLDKQCPEMLYVTDQTSKAIDSDNWEDFCEMRLPRCLSPLPPEVGKTTGIFTQDPFQPLEFSSCLSASHGNLQPAIRYTSTPIEPQALPGKTNPQYPLCTSPHQDELNCLVVGNNSCPLKSNRGHNGVATYSASEEKMTKMTDFENDPKHALETVNEPYRKKAKIAGYPDGVNTQTVKVLNPCSVKIKNLRHIANIQDISNSVSPEKIDCLKSAKTKNTVSKDLKSQEKLSVCKKSQPIKCKDQEACREKVQDITQPALLVTKCERGDMRPLQKRKCTKDLMKDLSTSVMNSSSAVAPSSSWHDDLQLPQISLACAPSQGSERASKVHRPSLDLAPTITTVNDFISKCELNKVTEPEMKNPFVEPEKVIPDVKLNREDEKQCKTHTFCDQAIFSVFPTITEHFLPVYHKPISILQTNAETNKTSLLSKKLREPLESAEMSPNLMNKNRLENKDKTKEIEKGVPGPDKPGKALDTDKKVDSTNRVEIEHVDGSSINVNGCLVNGKVAGESDISANTSLSFHDLNTASHFCTVPSARDVNNFHFQLENNLQLELNTLLHHFRSEDVTEEAKTNEQITECNDLQKVPIFIQTTEVTLIKTKGLHLGETRSIKIGKDLEKEKEKESTDHVDISGMNENEAGIRDIEVEVLDEGAQIDAGHGYEVVSDEGNIDDDVEESENSVDMDNDGEALAREEEFNRQHEEVVDTDAPSNQRGEEPDLSSSSVVILLDVNTESADGCSSAEEELVVDDISDSPVQSSPLVITPCYPILEEEDVLKEEVVVKRKKEEEEEEEEEVDVTGEESN
ncbi:uncharacterized protein LOC124399062 isoform X1 [Silurus meridionalis]|uniref:uncharacterized protein LOC124399062 isoform X1 n=1 Tax=Silurus meridionalis TaxID=175797 RepID=UPI001EEA12F7|nr:uncharacterized protein LOC124399062 isoform X1 [Silurus meridionalis]XP_046725716.1 uncharacterized protein LOC124399062 isoform X1 [Silurus meridionalis]